MRFKNVSLVFAVALLAVFTAGCNDPDKLAQNGDYQKAYDAYMKNAQGLEGSLAGQYDTGNLGAAKADAMKLVEQYCKAGEMKDKLGDAAGAKALYAKASKADYATTERYAVVSEVWIEAGNQQVWVPGGYEEVWVDGSTEQVWVDGGTEQVWVDGTSEEVWVDPYTRADGTYVKGYYRTVKHEGHYEQKTVAGHYEQKLVQGHYDQKYVDGHNVTKWVAGHYEQKTTYKTRAYAFSIASAYIDQARAKAGAPASAPAAPAAPAARIAGSADAAAIKAAKDRLDAGYQRWTQAGQKTSGTEYQGYLDAKKAYDDLVK